MHDDTTERRLAGGDAGAADIDRGAGVAFQVLRLNLHAANSIRRRRDESAYGQPCVRHATNGSISKLFTRPSRLMSLRQRQTGSELQFPVVSAATKLSMSKLFMTPSP